MTEVRRGEEVWGIYHIYIYIEREGDGEREGEREGERAREREDVRRCTDLFFGEGVF
jgi:hypothetical protein